MTTCRSLALAVSLTLSLSLSLALALTLDHVRTNLPRKLRHLAVLQLGHRVLRQR